MKNNYLIALLLFGTAFVGFTTAKKTGLKFAEKSLNGFCNFVPSGSSLVDGDTLSVQSFYMSTSEVTNREYNEFLTDLLRKGDLASYEIAKIDTAAWNRAFKNASMEPMASYYHSHPAYVNYPVVNVSKQGAELYCKWLTSKYDSLSNGEMKVNFRIPTRAEWVRAASGDNLNAPYSWSGQFLRNDKGCILANFLTMGSENITRNPVTGEMEVVEADFRMDSDGADLIAPAKSYMPSGLGFYNMNGNVAEFVSDGDFAVGGDWFSPGFDIQNSSIKEVTEPQPTVGFRVVTTFLGREVKR